MEDKILNIYKTDDNYICYKNDAVIIHYLMKFQYDSVKEKISFPREELGNVIRTLIKCEIDYNVRSQNKSIDDYGRYNKNHYDEILEKSKKSLSGESRVDFIRRRFI